MTVKTAVLVSGGGTNLQAMLDAKKAGAMSHVDFTLVVASRADAFALERAKKAGIETAVFKKEKTEPAEAYGERLLALLAAHGIELVVLAGFLTILPENVVRAYDHRMINIHPSLIPAFCGEGFYGLRVHEAALARGVKVTGATVHFVNEIADGGEILAQQPVAVRPGDTPEVLQRRVMEEAEWILLPRTVEAVAAKMTEERNA